MRYSATAVRDGTCCVVSIARIWVTEAFGDSML
jgi:hypothetical protein